MQFQIEWSASAQVGCLRSAQGWCTGKAQRDGMGREAGGGSGWGTHVNPRLIHVNVWQKPLQHCKVSSLQLITINGKTNRMVRVSLTEKMRRTKRLQGNEGCIRQPPGWGKSTSGRRNS